MKNSDFCGAGYVATIAFVSLSGSLLPVFSEIVHRQSFKTILTILFRWFEVLQSNKITFYSSIDNGLEFKFGFVIEIYRYIFILNSELIFSKQNHCTYLDLLIHLLTYLKKKICPLFSEFFALLRHYNAILQRAPFPNQSTSTVIKTMKSFFKF
jgi:hypothetical protein